MLVLTAAGNHVALAAIDGLEVATAPRGRDGQLDLAAALALLAERGLTRVFSEGGPTIAAALIAADLADEVLIFTAVKPLGRTGVPTMAPEARARLGDPGRYRLIGDRELGADRLRHYERMA